MTETNRDGVLAEDTPTEAVKAPAVSTNSKASPPPCNPKAQSTKRLPTRGKGK